RMQGRSGCRWRIRQRKQQLAEQEQQTPLQQPDEEDDKPLELAKNLGGCLNAYAEAGDLAQVSSLLESNVPHSSDWLGFTALHQAARAATWPSAAACWPTASRPMRAIKWGRTPLHLAAAGRARRCCQACCWTPGAIRTARGLPAQTGRLHCRLPGQLARPLWTCCCGRAHSISPVNKFGQTPLQVAESLGHAGPGLRAALLSRFATNGSRSLGRARSVETRWLQSTSTNRWTEACRWPGVWGWLDDLGDIQLRAARLSLHCSSRPSSDSPASAAFIGLTSATSGLELADAAASSWQIRGMATRCPSGCCRLRESAIWVPAHLSSLGLRVRTMYGSSLLGWFYDTDGSVVNLRATHEESASRLLVVSAFPGSTASCWSTC
uniref:ANK_REP_REGION domain-containing protein n=1 Tax=Macrostomum lignano TaxID=282301 RepID=A0A1I8JPU9_9PLAT